MELAYWQPVDFSVAVGFVASRAIMPPKPLKQQQPTGRPT